MSLHIIEINKSFKLPQTIIHGFYDSRDGEESLRTGVGKK